MSSLILISSIVDIFLYKQEQLCLIIVAKNILAAAANFIYFKVGLQYRGFYN